LVHERGPQVADLALVAARGRVARGRLLGQGAHVALGLLLEHVEGAVGGAVRRDLDRRQPPAVDVAEEVVLRADVGGQLVDGDAARGARGHAVLLRARGRSRQPTGGRRSPARVQAVAGGAADRSSPSMTRATDSIVVNSESPDSSVSSPVSSSMPRKSAATAAVRSSRGTRSRKGVSASSRSMVSPTSVVHGRSDSLMPRDSSGEPTAPASTWVRAATVPSWNSSSWSRRATATSSASEETSASAGA